MPRFLSLLCALLLSIGLFSCALAEENEALFPAKDGWLYGYIHQDGTWAIAPTFTRAYPFQESGLAPVRTELADLFSNDEPFRMVNQQGETAVLLEDWKLDMAYLGVNNNQETPIIAGNANLLVNRDAYRRSALYLSHTGQLLELTPAFLGYEPSYTSHSLAQLPGVEDDLPFILDIRLWGERLVIRFMYDEMVYKFGEVDDSVHSAFVLLDLDGRKIHDGIFESAELMDYNPAPITAPYLPILQGDTVAFIDPDGQIVAQGLPEDSSLTDAGDAIELEYHALYQLIETGQQMTYLEYAAYRAGKNPSGYAVYEDGYVDAQGNPVVFACLAGEEHADPAEFTEAGVAWVYLLSEELEGHFLMDTHGNNLTGTSPWYFPDAIGDSTDQRALADFFAQPWEPASLDFTGMNYLNCRGETLFPGAPLEEADPFCNGLARAVYLSDSCKPLEIYLDLSGRVVWAEDGRQQEVQQWLDSGATFSADDLTLEEATRIMAGEWELVATCNGGPPIQLLEGGDLPWENARWALEEAAPGTEEYEFVLVIYEDGEPTSREGIHFYSTDSFWCYDAGMHGEGYKRVPPGYCAQREATSETPERVLPQGTLRFGKPKEIPAYDQEGQPRTLERGLLNFRSSAYRDNGILTDPEKSGQLPQLTGLNLLWEQPIGPAAAGEEPFWQPLIVKWPKNIRESSNIVSHLKNTKALKEVIAVGTDQRIHLFELYTGQRTRAPLASDRYIGMPALHDDLPILAAPSLSGTTFLQMTDGSTITRLKSSFSLPKSVLWQNEQLLVQTDTSIVFTPATGTFTSPTGAPFGVDDLAPCSYFPNAQSPVSARGDTVYYGSRRMGVTAYSLKEDCIVGEWTGPGTVVSSIAIKETAKAGDHPLKLHKQTLLYFGTTTMHHLSGACSLVCLDADTMEEQWTLCLCAEADGNLPGGCIASPVIGQGPLNGLVYFTLTDLIPSPQEADETYSFVAALDAATGEIRWQKPLCGRTVSSPVAAISSDGRGYLYQADGEGNLYMLDGLTGEVMDCLSLGSSVTSAPALYQQYLVVRVTKDGQEVLCGVGLGE